MFVGKGRYGMGRLCGRGCLDEIGKRVMKEDERRMVRM